MIGRGETTDWGAGNTLANGLPGRQEIACHGERAFLM